MVAKPDMGFLQVVMACISGDKCKESMGKVTDQQLRQALEYFNLPDCMWPTGLYIIHTQETKCDKVANQLMASIKADMRQLVAEDRSCASNFSKNYRLYDGRHDLSLQWRGESAHIEFSQALKGRLKVLAAAERLGLSFPYHGDGDELIQISVCIT